MAPKKKEETEKKKTKKSSKKIKLTFSPIVNSAAKYYHMLLRQKVVDEKFNRVLTYEPAIEGLPLSLTVQRGEIIEVTEAQYKALQERGHVETDEECAKRTKFINELGIQHPNKLSYEEIASETAMHATLLQSQNVVYNDKLIRVD